MMDGRWCGEGGDWAATAVCTSAPIIRVCMGTGDRVAHSMLCFWTQTGQQPASAERRMRVYAQAGRRS